MNKLKKSLVARVCRLGEFFKPVLIKILPKSYLRNIKKKMIESAINENSAENRVPFDRHAFPAGVNLIGYIRSQMGLGEGCRLIAGALNKTKIPFGIIDTKVGNPFNHNERAFEHKTIEAPKYAVNIFHINPEQLYHLQLTLPQSTWDRHYNIGLWLWELDEIPTEWEKAFSLIDEVWTPSNFCAEAFRKKSPVPVHVIPYGLEAHADATIKRDYFKLPDGFFLYLIMFDTNSTIERKNPLGAISAYKKAFRKSGADTGIVIKINNPTDEAIKLIKSELDGYQNVFLIEKTLSKPEVHSLISLCDVFVSLHRSEGFGLVIAEAMLLKTPVIATNWSANSDFMTTRSACCVDSELVEIKTDHAMYKTGMRWAEPDITQAAVFMKLLKTDKDYREELSENAYKFITENFSVKKSAKKISDRIEAILKK